MAAGSLAISPKPDAIAAVRSNRIAAIGPSMIVVQMIHGRSTTLRAKLFNSDSKLVQFK
jgi:hypothetical protein